MMKTHFLSLVVFTVVTTFTLAGHAQAPRPLVVVISVDGLGAHLLSSFSTTDTPNLTLLAQDGDQAIRAETVSMTKTIPGHASMLSGVDTPKHGRTHNDLDPDLKKLEVPTIFDLAKKNGLKSVAVFGKDKLHFLFDTGALDQNICPQAWPVGDYYGRWPSVADSRAIQALRETKPDLLFLHYAAVDSMGHIFKWDSSIQRWAVRKVDESIGRVLEELRKNVDRDFVILLTADHGGNDVSHGQMNSEGHLKSPETDLVIPWIVYRARGSIVKPIQLRTPQETVKVWDTAATAAALLELEVPKEWNWDGVNRLKLPPVSVEVSKPLRDTLKPSVR